MRRDHDRITVITTTSRTEGTTWTTTATQFATPAQTCQAVSAQAAAIHQVFVDTPGISSGSGAATEAATIATD